MSAYSRNFLPYPAGTAFESIGPIRINKIDLQSLLNRLCGSCGCIFVLKLYVYVYIRDVA